MRRLVQLGSIAACGLVAAVALVVSLDGAPEAVGSAAAAMPPVADDDGDRAIAFPGAVGYGRFATGWRGGEIVPRRGETRP